MKARPSASAVRSRARSKLLPRIGLNESRLATRFALGALVLVGCGAADDTDIDFDEATQSVEAALTSADVLGFETTGSWTASTGSVAFTDHHTQGARALSVSPRGYVTYTSARLGSLNGVESQVGFDLWLPRAQANPNWMGAAQLYLSIPSAGVNNAYLGQVELTGLPLDHWAALSYSIPTDLQSKLRGRYTDATFGIALNVPANSTGTYLLDNLRFLGSQPETMSITLADSPVNLKATKYYDPVHREDGSLTPPSPVTFTIPRSIAVTLGSSGNGSATFSYRQSDGTTVRCTYRGQSTTEHDVTDLGRARAAFYRFSSCSNAAVAGSDATGTRFDLSVQDGDSRDPMKQTTIELALGKGGCGAKLEPALSAEESIAIRNGFSWGQTRALPERDPQGHPALYYALLYIEDREQYQELDELLIHRSLLPIFDSELQRFDGQCGEFQFSGDGRGQFVYAMLPAVTYNKLRELALTPDPVDGDQSLFSVIKLLDVPDSRARNSDGSVSWDALKQAGFYYMNQTTFPSDDDTEVHQNPFWSSFKRRVAKVVAKAARGAVREIVEGLGAVDRFFAGSVKATVKVTVQNRDPLFNPPDPAHPSGPRKPTPMMRAWGPQMGTPITPVGARLEILQYLQFGLSTTPIPTGFSGNLGADGTSTLKVAKNRALRNVCIATTNNAAEITSFLTENLVCGFGLDDGRSFTRDVTLDLSTNDKEIHALTQITDARAYLDDVAGYHSSHRAEVLDGRIANLVGKINGGAFFTPCFDFPGLGGDFQASTADFYWGLSFLGDGLLQTVTPFLAVDMMLPDANDLFDSRAAAVHEYGHFTLCSMLYDRGLTNVAVAYTEAAHQRSANGGHPDAFAEGAYINESFADLITSQVTGGTNEIAPPNSQREVQINYCTGSGICMDNNFATYEDFEHQLFRVASTLHDAFDGQRNHKGNVPNDGDLLTLRNGTLLTNQTPYGDARDENVKMPGTCLAKVINFWDNHGELLEEESFFAGLTDAMRDPSCGGANWCDICHLYALHRREVPLGVPSEWEGCTRLPVSDWIGAPPSGTLNLEAATCTPCPPNSVSQNGVCRQCAPNEIPSGATCVACTGATPFRMGDQCVATCDPDNRCGTGAGCMVPDANGVCQSFAG